MVNGETYERETLFMEKVEWILSLQLDMFRECRSGYGIT